MIDMTHGWAKVAVIITAFLAASPLFAATYDVVVDADIAVIPSPVLVGQEVRIYASVVNVGTEDIEGLAFISDDGNQLAVKPYSAKAGGKAEEVWSYWKPLSTGTHTIRVDAVNDGNIPDATPGDNSRSISVFVDLDTDNDGIGNAADPDDDNDGVPDTQDQFPLDPSKSKDTDGDGQDDSVDSDDDNDGLYDFEEQPLGTDPLKRDTDGDGVGDKEDEYPLDPTKSKKETPPPPAGQPASGGSPPATLPAESPSPPSGQGAMGDNSVTAAASDQLPQNAANTSAEATTSSVASDKGSPSVTATWVTLPIEEKGPQLEEKPKTKRYVLFKLWKEAGWVKWLWALAAFCLLLAFIFHFIGKKNIKKFR